jgi:hypothetical protein
MFNRVWRSINCMSKARKRLRHLGTSLTVVSLIMGLERSLLGDDRSRLYGSENNGVRKFLEKWQKY